MSSPRKVKDKDPMRGKVLQYLKEHPQELRYIVGDYLSENKIIEKANREIKIENRKLRHDLKLCKDFIFKTYDSIEKIHKSIKEFFE